MIKKLHYPSFFDVTPATIVIIDGLNEDGTEKEVIRKDIKCNYSETTKRVQNKDGLWVTLSGVVHFKGDICPNISNPTGYIELFGKKIRISNYSRLRNPDGTVNHTKLELI